MRNTLLVVIATIFGLCSVNAQWYTKHCGVIPINVDNVTYEEFECMWERASKNVRSGKIISLAGISTTAVGLIWASEVTGFELYIPYAIMTAGLISFSVGLPIWITGSSRQSKLRKSPHYNNLSFKTLKITPAIHRNYFNYSYCYGLTASVKF